MNATYAVPPLPTALDIATPRVFVVTTPGAAAPWLTSAAGTDWAGVRFEQCSLDELDRHLDDNENSRACLLVESPASALARGLADGSADECQGLLDAWSAAGRRLLLRALTQPARCLCANINEIHQAMPAWHQALARFLGVQTVSAPAAANPPDPVPNPLDELVAQAVVNEHREASTLFEQLLACCVVLDAPVRHAPAPLAAAGALRELRSAAPLPSSGPQVDADGASVELESLRREAHETLDRLFTAQADLEAALIEREALRDELDTARAEARQALERLVAAQADLKAALTAQDTQRRELAAANDRSRRQESQLREAQQAQAESQSVADVARKAEAAASAAQEALRREIEAASDRSRRQEGQLLEAQRALGVAQAESRTAADAARQEADTLLEKLHEAHEQLGRYYLDARALRSVPAMLAHGDGPIIGATGVHLAGEHVEGRHRHLDLQLRDVQFLGRRRPDGRVRLVEHLGHPGLVLFSTPPTGSWLSAWETSGQEGVTDYMLIVPGDSAGQAALSRFGRTDWQVITDLAGLVLRGAMEGGSARWAGVARRLCRELAAMPVRLRYDQLEVEQDGKVLRARFGNAMFGALEWPSVTVQWAPDGASGRLELLAGAADAFPPLARWPVDSEAETDRWCIPVGAWAAGRDKRRAWAALPEVDRTFLLALLDALPAVESCAAAAAAGPLAIASRALLREAHALSRSLARRQLLRRLLGRVTSR